MAMSNSYVKLPEGKLMIDGQWHQSYQNGENWKDPLLVFEA